MSDALVQRWLERVVVLRPGEGRALAWSFTYFFCLLAGYYVLRPLRDEMGIAGGVRNLQWLFTATFVAMLAAVPVFGAMVARLPRRRFVPLVYHFFVANIVMFWLLLTLNVGKVHVARVFFVWISVFNLFAVSVFWSFMADLYASEQGKRLFGFIAAGGSAGALLGPALTVGLAVPLGPVNLLFVAALFLELAVQCARQLEAAAALIGSAQVAPAMGPEAAAATTQPAPPLQAAGLGGNWLAGIGMVLRSPYLAGIALWVFLLSLAGTFLYFQQANIVAAASDDPAVRTRIFATIDLSIGILTIIVQFFATGRLIARFGVGRAAAALPLVFALGFLALAVTPMLFVVIAFQAIQRTANFALSNPAREVLFTVLEREEKYKAKNVIDIVVFRGADAVSGWLFAVLRGAGLELSTISLATVPLAGAWLALALALGRAQERRARPQPPFADERTPAMLRARLGPAWRRPVSRLSFRGSAMETVSSITTVSHVIQLAVAPVFLLSGIGAILAVLINRLGRIIDRYRVLEHGSAGTGAGEDSIARLEMAILSRRARLIHWAISLCTIGALCICIVVATLFIGSMLRVGVSQLIALMFVGAMLALIAGLLSFLREITLATGSIHVHKR